MYKICQFCGKSFDTPYKTKKYCSSVCRRSERTYRDTGVKPIKEGRKCITCGLPIPAEERSDKLYCCKACKNKNYYRTKKRKDGSDKARIIDDLSSLITSVYITVTGDNKTVVNRKFYSAISCLGLHLKRGYVEASYKGIQMRLHSIVYYLEHGFKPSKSTYIDHINRDKLDNRVENLRLVNATQNSANRGMFHNKRTSKYKGVYPTSSGKWQPQISYNGKRKTLGSYDDEEEAARVYNSWALYYYGSYACLNKIDY